MEEKFYLDDFELSLKEQVNQFKMVPSKKVWHGIYNDLHPGRRWPSVMISLLLIFSVVFVGYINTNADKKASPANEQVPVQTTSSAQKADLTIEHRKASATEGKDRSSIDNALHQRDVSTTQKPEPLTASKETKPTTNSKADDNPVGNIGRTKFDESVLLASVVASDASRKGKGYLRNNNGIFSIEQIPGSHADLAKSFGTIGNTATENTFGTNSNRRDFSLKLPFAILPSNIKVPTQLSANIPSLSLNSVRGQSAANEQNVASAARNEKKRNEKISWTYYAAPSLSNVSFKGRSIKSSGLNSTLVAALPQQAQKDMGVIHSAALGFEAGLQMNYSIVPNLQFTVGTYFTRSGYNIVSNLVHPTLSNLVLNDPSTGGTYTRSFVTHYGDGTGMSTVTLHNYSYQASIPVGLQYMVWANDKLQVNLAAAMAPSYVIEANAYVLSSDGKNYVNVPDLLRKWNVSSNFAPFISFRSHNLKWNIGPNIRYQWLSSYEKNYPVKEHLIDYGIRVGVSK